MSFSRDHFNSRVDEKARNALDVYFYEREKGVRWASSAKRYGEDSAREYGDRFLVELIQNAYDANPRGSTGGKVAVALELGEDEHGVLYVANTGSPFTDENFDAITDIAQSDKPPGEGIGNKGVGFKSVLQVSDVPEVYSTQPDSTSGQFDGYCFRLPAPADIAYMVGPNDLNDVVRDVPPYALPRPIQEMSERLDEFLAAGFCTVIRLPLSSAKAAERVESEIHHLAAASTPLLLFLDRITLLTLVIDDHEGTRTVDRELRRLTTPIGGDDNCQLLVEEVDLGEQGQFVVASRNVLGADLNRAILDSAPEIDPRWAAWKRDSAVSVACRLDHDDDDWRFYTFLPMDGSPTPLCAHANAPFFTKLDRTSVRFTVPFNSFLLDEIAALCADAAIWIRDNLPGYSALCLDLICWDDSELQRLRDAFGERGHPLEDVHLIPLLSLEGKVQSFGTVASARRWGPFDDTISIVTAERLCAETDAQIIDPALGDRIEVFSQLRLDLSNHQDDGEPTEEEWATWLERVAKRLRRSTPPAEGDVWLDFYDDIATIFAPIDTDVLHGRRLIIDENHRLQRCGTSPDRSKSRTVFFAPVREQTEGEEDVDSSIDIKPPPELSKAIAFTSTDLVWFVMDGGKKSARKCRNFLEQEGLVRRYRTNDVLSAIGRFVTNNRDTIDNEKQFEAALHFAYRLRERATDAALRAVGLYVPTRSGWHPAADASFSEAWVDTNGPLLAELVQVTGAVSPEIGTIGDRLLQSPDRWLPSEASIEGWTGFLRRLGVRDGLMPLNRTGTSFRAQGAVFTPEAWARAADLPNEFAEAWRRQLESPRPFEAYPQTDCQSTSKLWSLPGQFEHSEFLEDAQARYAELLTRSLATWPDEFLIVRMRRSNHPQDFTKEWPTPVAVFLRSASWVPIRAAGAREIRSPEGGWYFDDDKGETPPDFAPLLPFPLRRVIRGNSILRERIRAWCGIRCWNDERDAVALVRALTTMLDAVLLTPAEIATFAKEYERALHRSLAQDADPWSTDDAPTVLVRVGDKLESRVLKEGAERVYVASNDDGGTRRLLEELGAPIVCGSAADSSKIVATLRERAGEIVRLITDAEVRVMADGLAVTESTRGVTLIGHERRWLIELVIAAMDHLGSRFRRHSDRGLRDSARRLQAIELIPAVQLTLSVDGHPPADTTDHRGVFLVPGTTRPLIVVPEFSGEVGWETLEQVTHPIAIVVGAPEIGSTLFEAIVRLRRAQGTHGDLSPSREECATALGISRQQLNDATAVLHSEIDKWRDRIPIAIACFVSAIAGREADGLLAEATDENDVLALLSRMGAPDERTILSAATDAEDLVQFRALLHLRYREFNDALIDLNREPLFDTEAHRLAFEYFVKSRSDAILQSMREAFMVQFLSGAGLERYIELRRLPGLAGDDDWLIDYEVPPEHLMTEHVEAWLSAQGIESPSIKSQTSTSIDKLRSGNRKTVTVAGDAAGTLVRAWCEKAGIECPELWLGDGCGGRLADWADEQGLLDFAELHDISPLMKHIHRCSLWPRGMPLTVSESELALSVEDLERGRSAQEQQRAVQRLERSTIVLGAHRFGTDPDQFAEIAAAVRNELSPELLQAPFRTDLGAAPSVGRRGAVTNGPASYYRRSPSFTEGQRAVIGLAAEVAALEWLKAQKPYADAVIRWCSGYKDKVEGGNEGDDTLGYDIEVMTKSQKYLFEVKGTADDNTEFEMSENEVNIARRNTRRDAYRIIFVRYVLDPERMWPMLLPNPFSQRGADTYRVVGRGLRYRFTPTD